MAWTVTFKESVPDDLRWFGKKESRLILQGILARLGTDPLEVSKNMKTLRPNPVAKRELRLFGNYRVLFNVRTVENTVDVVLVGEKRGNSLFVQGEVFTTHHESSPP